MEASDVEAMREVLKAFKAAMTENEITNLKPCPFCGGDANLYGKNTRFGVPYVECTVCGVQMGGDSDAEVAKLWNNRYERRSVANAM